MLKAPSMQRLSLATCALKASGTEVVNRIGARIRCLYIHLYEQKNQLRCALERVSNTELTSTRRRPFRRFDMSLWALSHSGIATEKARRPRAVACTCFSRRSLPERSETSLSRSSNLSVLVREESSIAIVFAIFPTVPSPTATTAHKTASCVERSPLGFKCSS
jgi:hypothetical protein